MVAPFNGLPRDFLRFERDLNIRLAREYIPGTGPLGWATDCRVHRVRAPCTCAAPCADPVQPCGEFSFRVLIIARQALTETDRLLPHQAMGQHAHARRSRKTSSRRLAPSLCLPSPHPPSPVPDTRPPEAGHVGRAVRAVHTARRSAPRPQRGRAPRGPARPARAGRPWPGHLRRVPAGGHRPAAPRVPDGLAARRMRMHPEFDWARRHQRARSLRGIGDGPWPSSPPPAWPASRWRPGARWLAVAEPEPLRRGAAFCLLAPRTARSRQVFFSFFFIMRCPGRHRAVPTTGSGGPCAGPQVPVQTLWPNLVRLRRK